MALDPSLHPFFRDINEAAEKTAKALAEFGVTVSIVTRHFSTDQNGEPEVLDEFPEGVTPDMFDGIASPGNLTDSLRPQLRPGIPVAYYNNAPSDDRGLIYVGCDYEKSGEIAAGLCALSGEKNAKIVILSEQGPFRPEGK